MMSFFRKVRGSVSLILIFVMLPMLTQATMIVDGSRITSAKTVISGAGDLTMNAALSTYDRALQDVYGLFAVSDDMDELQTTFQAYFSNTLSGHVTKSGVPESEVRDYIDQMTNDVMNSIFGLDYDDEELGSHLTMDTISVSVKGNQSAALSNPAVMKTQIVEYMKYKAPVMFATGILDQMRALSDSTKQSDAVNQQITYTQSLDTLQTACNEAKNAIYSYNDRILELETATLSGTNYNTTGYIDALFRNEQMFTDKMNVYGNLESATKNMLFYKNLYQYWGGDNRIFSWSDFEPKLSAVALWDLNQYHMITNEDGSYNTSKLKRENPAEQLSETVDIAVSGANNGNFQIVDIVAWMNAEFPVQEGSQETCRVKDWQGYKNYEVILAQAKTAEKAYNAFKDLLTEYNNAYGELTRNVAQSGLDGEEYIKAYREFLTKYDMDKLAELCAKKEFFRNAYHAFLTTYNNIYRSVASNTGKWYHYYDKNGQSGLNTDEFQGDDRFSYEAYCIERELLELYSKEVQFKETSNKDEQDRTIYMLEDAIMCDTVVEWDDAYLATSGKALDDILKNVINECVRIRDSYKTSAQTNFNNAKTLIDGFKGIVDDVVTKAGTVCDKLNAVKSAAQTVSESHSNWGNAIKEVPEGSTKDTMQASHSAEGEKIDAEEIAALITFAENQKTTWTALRDYLNSIQYFGQNVCGNTLQVSTFVNGIDTGSWYESAYKDATTISDITEEKVNQTASGCMNSFYKRNPSGSVEMPSDIKNKPVIQNRFIQFGYALTDAKDARSGCLISFYFSTPDVEKAKMFYEKLLSYTKGAEGQEADKGAGKKNAVKEAGGSTVTPTAVPVDSGMSTASADDVQNAFMAISGANTDTQTSNPMQYDVVGEDGQTRKQEIKGGASDIDSVNGGDENKDANQKKSQEQQKMMDSSTNYMEEITEFLGEGLNAAISYAYVEEYITNMFSCLTTNKSEDGKELSELGVGKIEKSLEGLGFSTENNKYYRSEQEYILWGGSPNSAVGLTMATIFGIRLVLNTVYAFTSAEIQALACQIATAIAGWTVFGIPLVQAIVTVVLALAESGLDLVELTKGGAVPIYKSSSTWKCSLSGILNETIDYGVDKASEAATDFLTEFANEQIDNLGTSVNDFITDQLDAAVTSLKDSVCSAISSTVMQMYAVSGLENLNNSADLDVQIQTALNQLKSDLAKNGDTPTNEAIAYGLDLLMSSEHYSSFVSKVKDGLQGLNQENFARELQTKVVQAIDSYVDENIETKMKTFVDKQTADLKHAVETNITKGMTELTDDAKSAIQKELDKYTGKLDATKLPDTKVDSKDTAGSIEMNYKQYLKIFMMVGLLADQNALLQRCAALIQVNMNHMPATSDRANKGYIKKTEYNLSMPSAYTMVEIDATVMLNTIFSYGIDVSGTTGTTSQDDAGLYSGLKGLWSNSGTSELNYHSVMGF